MIQYFVILILKQQRKM